MNADDWAAIRMADFEEYCGGDFDFMTWLTSVDLILTGSLGLGVFDISDKPWRRTFDDGLTPAEGVESQVEMTHNLF